MERVGMRGVQFTETNPKVELEENQIGRAHV